MLKKIICMFTMVSVLLSLTVNFSVVVSGNNADIIYIEGESLSGYDVDATIPALSGGQFAKVERTEMPYASISLTVTAPETGRYTMECVANECVGNWTNPFNFVINGFETNANDIKFGGAANGMFATYKAEVELQKGTNTIALNATDRRTAYAGNLSMIYLDYISFEPIVEKPIEAGNPSVKIEGEAFPGYTVVEKEICSEGAYAQAAGNEMELEFYIAVGGVYTMRMVTAAQEPNVILNGSDTATMKLAATSGAFSAYELNVKLENGRNTLKLTVAEEFMTLDYIAFYEIRGIYIEGEDIGYGRDTSAQGLSGGAFGKSESSSADYAGISMTITAPQTGKYNMKCIATNYPDSEPSIYNKFNFVINGSAIDAGDKVTAKACTGFMYGSNMFSQYEMEVDLTAGENTFALCATGYRTEYLPNTYSMIYLDYVTFEPASEKPAGFIKISAEEMGQMGYNTATDSDLGIMYAKAEGATPAKTLIELPVYATKAGCYRMQYRAITTHYQSDMDRFSVSLNGAAWDGYADSKSTENSIFSNYETYVNLEAGKNNLSFTATGKSSEDIYRLYLGDVTFEPTGAEIVIEAASLPGCNTGLNEDSRTIFGTAEGMDGAEIAATFCASAEGQYIMEYKAGNWNGGNIFLSPHKVNLNGEEWDSESIKLRETASENDIPMAVYQQTVSLKKGKNTVRFAATKPREYQDKLYVLYWQYVRFTPIFNEGAISIQAEKTTVNIGESAKLFVSDKNGVGVSPESVNLIAYESSNDNVATVSESGVVCGVSGGTCKIKAMVTANRNYSAEITITVQNGIVIDSAAKSDNCVMVKYASALPRLSGNEVTFIVRRFNKIEGLPYHLKEIKPIVSDMPTANLYQTVEIPMDSTAGDLELFVWGNLNTLQPLCGVITVE